MRNVPRMPVRLPTVIDLQALTNITPWASFTPVSDIILRNLNLIAVAERMADCLPVSAGDLKAILVVNERHSCSLVVDLA